MTESMDGMTVGDVIKLLQKFPRNYQLVMDLGEGGTTVAPIIDITEQYIEGNSISVSLDPVTGLDSNCVVLWKS